MEMPCLVSRSRWVYVGGPFAQDIELTCNLFVLSPNSKHLVSSGHWDNSFRVHSVEKGKLSSRIAHHNGNVVLAITVNSLLIVQLLKFGG